jgi:hypothetical protein
MNDKQRGIVFWVLLLLSPVLAMFTEAQTGGKGGLFAGIAVLLACIAGAFFVRAGRKGGGSSGKQ